MGDSTIDSELFVLYDRWPGVPQPGVESNLLDGITGASHHNVATAAFPVGTKVQLRNDNAVAGQPGLATLVYLKYEGTDAPTAAAKQVCVPDSATLYYVVTNDPDNLIKLPTDLACIMISAMTDAYYGWFWCGGICPESHVSDLGGNYATEGNVEPGPITAHNLSADAIGFGPYAATEGYFGFALAADA